MHAQEEKAAKWALRGARGGDDDVDALLAAFKLADSAVGRVTFEDGARPSPRTCACLVACTVKVASGLPPPQLPKWLCAHWRCKQCRL